MPKLLTFLLLLASSYLYGQGFELENFRFGELELVSTRERILQVMGKPMREYEPHYECGFFSDAVQSERYWQMDYGFVTFIGNTQEGYTVENVDFTNPGAVMYYNHQPLSGKSDLADLIQILGAGNAQLFQVRIAGSDVVLHFMTENGKLVSFAYWTPC